MTSQSETALDKAPEGSAPYPAPVSKRARSKPSKKKLQRLIWGRRCWMCGDVANTTDHYMPIALGGENSLENRRPACQSCNRWKGSMHPDLIERLMKELKGPPKYVAKMKNQKN